jgi:hypothetical protein
VIFTAGTRDLGQVFMVCMLWYILVLGYICRSRFATALWKGLLVPVQHRRLALATALALGSATFIGSSAGSAQECHYAYGGCLPYVDDLNCEDIGHAVLEVWDIYDDPYRLDDAYDIGNGWTCDGVG